jgi:hypothetical protein
MISTLICLDKLELTSWLRTFERNSFGVHLGGTDPGARFFSPTESLEVRYPISP